jgi:ribosomal protein S8
VFTEDDLAEGLGSLVNLRSLEISGLNVEGTKLWKAIGDNLKKLQYVSSYCYFQDVSGLSG